MFYDKSTEWRTQGRRDRIPRHVARKTLKYCEGCNCSGFPYCFNRIFPKTRINIETSEVDKICLRCGCSSCPSKKEQRWAKCQQCRNYYLSHLHCGCHSWWIMDDVPFDHHKFDSRVYRGNYDDGFKRECDTCHAVFYPYNKREPCNFEKHYESHEHFSDGNIEKNITRKSGASKLQFCHQCHWVKNYQCGFCSKKFNTANTADRHILSKHKELLSRKNDVKCFTCEIRPEWEKLGRRDGLQKWILKRQKKYERSLSEFTDEEVDEQVAHERMLDECDGCNKPSYSDAVKK